MVLTIMILILLLSIILQIMIGVLYQKIEQETENMQESEDKNILQCKNTFEKYYELNNGIIPISSFVEKFVNNVRVGKCKVTLVSHLSGQLMLLMVFAGGIKACMGIIENKAIHELLPYYMLSLFGLYAYFSIISFIDIPGKKEIIKMNVKDYFEGSMLIRLKISKENQKKEKEIEKRFQQEFQKSTKKTMQKTFTKPEEQELEDLLQEILT